MCAYNIGRIDEASRLILRHPLYSGMGRSLITKLFDGLYIHYLAVTFAAYLLCWVIYSTFFHKLSSVPGPIAARYTELWRTRRYFLGKWHEDIVELHRRYGPVVRIAPNEVAFVDKKAMIQLYGHSTGTRKVFDISTSCLFSCACSLLTDPLDAVVPCMGYAKCGPRRKSQKSD